MYLHVCQILSTPNVTSRTFKPEIAYFCIGLYFFTTQFITFIIVCIRLRSIRISSAPWRRNPI